MNKKIFDDLCKARRAKGIEGSLSINIGELNEEVSFLFRGNSNERAIHKAVYELDSEYAWVAVNHCGDNGLDTDNTPLPELSSSYSLDEAVLTHGIGHTHGYKIKESGLIVRFAYDINELN